MLLNTKSLLVAFAIILLSSAGLLAQPVFQPRVYTGNLGPKPVTYVEGRVLIKFAEGVTPGGREAIVRSVGAQLAGSGYRNAFEIASVPSGTVLQVVEALSRNPNVEFAHPDIIAHAFADFVPGDPYYAYQWHLDNPVYGGIEMEQAWGLIGGGGKDVIVAVLDTGILQPDGSPCFTKDFESNTFVDGYDFINGDPDATDDNNHGTHVAGTIAQATNNGKGVAGVAFGVSLMPVKVLAANGSGSISAIANGINFAADNGAHIINMSLGTDSNPRFLGALQDAVRYAHGKGVLIVAAAGNSGRNKLSYPAGYPEVVAVGATKYNEALASYSNYGEGIELVAPGGENEDLNKDTYADMILQETFNGDPCEPWYYFFAGTSMASPHVAAVGALLFSAGVPDAATVRQILQDSADDLGASGYDTVYGHGLVNAYKALLAAGPTDQPPSVTLTNPADGAVLAGEVVVTADATDDDGVTQVEFFLNTLNNSLGADTNGNDGWSVSWNTSLYTDGDHEVIAQGTDTAGQTNGDLVMVTVDNVDSPPSVQVTSPSEGATVSGTISVEATAGDDRGLARVDFFVDGGFLASDSDGSNGWSVLWESISAGDGAHTVSATAVDSLGQTATDTISVSVNNTFSANVHVGDMDAVLVNQGSTWRTDVTVTVHDGGHTSHAGAAVSVTWGLAASGTASGTTNALGQVTFSSPSVPKREGSISLAVTQVVSSNGDPYDPNANHDPDGDSDGTVIIVSK